MPKKAAAKKLKVVNDASDDDDFNIDEVVVKFIEDASALGKKTNTDIVKNIQSVTLDKLHLIEGWNKASKAKKDNLVAALLAILSGSPDEPVKDTTNNEPTKSEDKEEKGKADESGSRTAKRKRKTARPGCVLVTDCIKVHNAIHDYPKTKSVTLSTGETINITTASNKCRKAVVANVSFMEQNVAKPSTFARKAKQGHKITWVLTAGRWGMLCDGRVEIDCSLFDHDEHDLEDEEEEEEENGKTTTTTTSTKKSEPKKEEMSDTHLLSLSISFPKYWENPNNKTPSRFTLPESSDEFKKLSAMFIKTAECNAKIKSIVRLQHPILWMRYFLKRQHVAEVNDSKPDKISYVLTELLDNTTNEYYFFHGCNPTVVDKIIDGGFDERLGSLSGLFGSGIYFAENSAKSIAYTHTASCKQVGANYGNSVCTCKGSKESRNIFISRAVIGTPWIRLVSTDRENPMRRPPERPNGSLYDSVMGECKKHDKQAHLPVREYIVYDRHQTYPEYLVEFSL